MNLKIDQVQARTDTMCPQFSSCKTATCLDYAKRANKRFSSPLFFWVGASKPDRSCFNREVWWVRPTSSTSLNPKCQEGSSQGLQVIYWNLIGIISNKLKEAGGEGVQIQSIASDIGHWNSNHVKSIIEKLTSSKDIRLCRFAQVNRASRTHISGRFDIRQEHRGRSPGYWYNDHT